MLPSDVHDRQDERAPARASFDETWTTILKLNCDFPASVFEDVMESLVQKPNLTSTFLIRADILYDQTHLRFVSQIKEDYRPRTIDLPEWTLERTIVRELIPRNAQLDRTLIQTCQFFSNGHKRMVVYIPHVENSDEIPYYHPKVRMVAFYHEDGLLTLKFMLFDVMTERLQRTGLKLLQTVHKHGHGNLKGYEKRVHHDRIVPQRQYQETYARLKATYAKRLVDEWVEVTDPGKHVFEELGIAAFLIELWRGSQVRFVDIGCGNGLLTYLLLSEGYDGYGFDARRRKTWSIYPKIVQDRLFEKVFVPSILGGEELPAGSFVISNHADELTAWTPLLAYLHGGSFLALPCCSHDLSGKRFRAPVHLPQQASLPEAGSLKKSLVQKKMASAYSTLCSYVEFLSAEVGFEVETEVLRIPSTRNHAIIGRTMHDDGSDRVEKVRALVMRELGTNVDDIAQMWIENGRKISKKPTSGH